MIKNCKNCGATFEGKSKNKYCCHGCYVEYRVNNFGVDISTIELKPIQQFSGLRDGMIECVVEGCDWVGQHLSSHLNIAHGIRTNDVKMALGLNLTQGLVTNELSEKMGERPQVLATIARHQPVNNGGSVTKPRRYGSKEGVEKLKATLATHKHITREYGKCLVCGEPAILNGLSGRRLYCSTQCRSKYYYTKGSNVMQCLVCGKEFCGPDGHYKTGDPTIKVCSIRCRQKRAGRIARGTWPGDKQWKLNRDSG